MAAKSAYNAPAARSRAGYRRVFTVSRATSYGSSFALCIGATLHVFHACSLSPESSWHAGKSRTHAPQKLSISLILLSLLHILVKARVRVCVEARPRTRVRIFGLSVSLACFSLHAARFFFCCSPSVEYKCRFYSLAA